MATEKSIGAILALGILFIIGCGPKAPVESATAANACAKKNCGLQGAGVYVTPANDIGRAVASYSDVLGYVLGNFHKPLFNCNGAPPVTSSDILPIEKSTRTVKLKEVISSEMTAKLRAGTKKALTDSAEIVADAELDRAVETATDGDYTFDVEVYTLTNTAEATRNKLCADDVAKDKNNAVVVSIAIVKMGATVKTTIKNKLKTGLKAVAKVDVPEVAEADAQASSNAKTKLDKVIDDAVGNDVEYMVGWGWR